MILCESRCHWMDIVSKDESGVDVSPKPEPVKENLGAVIQGKKKDMF
jgi:hypothetical protein